MLEHRANARMNNIISETTSAILFHFEFHPQELEYVVKNSIVLEAPRLVTTFPVRSVGDGRSIHVIADKDTYEILEMVETMHE